MIPPPLLILWDIGDLRIKYSFVHFCAALHAQVDARDRRLLMDLCIVSAEVSPPHYLVVVRPLCSIEWQESQLGLPASRITASTPIIF